MRERETERKREREKVRPMVEEGFFTFFTGNEENLGLSMAMVQTEQVAEHQKIVFFLWACSAINYFYSSGSDIMVRTSE